MAASEKDEVKVPPWRREPDMKTADRLMLAYMVARQPPNNLSPTNALIFSGYYVVRTDTWSTTREHNLAPTLILSEVRSTHPPLYHNDDSENYQILFIKHLHLFPPALRPILLGKSLLTSEILGLAKEVAEEQRFDGLPILADMLEDAGFNDTALLSHCRTEWDKHTPNMVSCALTELVLASARCHQLTDEVRAEVKRITGSRWEEVRDELVEMVGEEEVG